MVVCSVCASQNEAKALFCSQCGAELNAAYSQTSDEGRKQVTVLFSDLSDYTTLAERMDPEDLGLFMGKLYKDIRAIVEKYDGQVQSFVGDAAMVVFGVPMAHEDAPLRAVRTALEIHQMVASLDLEIDHKPAGTLSMHTGINTGLVIAGRHAREGDSTLLGDTVNLASRLSDHAERDEILLGSDTYRQVERHIYGESLGAIGLKGMSHLINIFRFDSLRDQPSLVHSENELGSTLIGRRAELSVIEDSFSNLSKGQRGIVLVSGDVGTGKSRLVSEFKNKLNNSSVRWREGHAFAYSQNSSYAPLVDLINRAWGIEELDAPTVVRQKISAALVELTGNDDYAPYIERLYSTDYPEQEEMSPDFWQAGLFKVLSGLLGQISSQGPSVILIEDLHWADPSSVQMLRRLLLETSHPIMFIFTYRPTFNLFSGNERLTLKSGLSEIELTDLSSSESQEMLESILDSQEVPSDLRRFVQDKIEGNPFYLEEVIMSLIEASVLMRDNGSWILTKPLGQVDIPSTVSGVISARLDHLDREKKALVQEASVIGRTFMYRILERISRVDRELKKGLSDLEQADLIRSRIHEPDIEYLFKHSVTQEVAYSGVLRSERRDLHERIGDVMEDLFSDRLSEYYEMLAFHYRRGISSEKAVDYLVKSGEKSLERYAVEESHQYFGEAYELMVSLSDGSDEAVGNLLDLVLNWAMVFYYRGNFKGLEEVLKRHSRQAEELGDPSRLGRLQMWLGASYYWRDRYTLAAPHLDLARKIAKETDDRSLLAHSLIWSTYVAVDRGLPDEAIDFGEKAMMMSQTELPEDEFLQYLSRDVTGYANWAMGNKAETGRIGREQLEHGNQSGHIRSQVSGYWLIGASHMIDGEWDEVYEAFNRALVLAVDPWYSLYPKTCLGLAYMLAGRYEEAEKPFREVYEFGNEFGAENLGNSSYGLLGAIWIAKGQMSKGMRVIEDVRQGWLTNGARWRYNMGEYILAEIFRGIATSKEPVKLGTIARNLGFLIKNVPNAAKKAEAHYRSAIAGASEIKDKATEGQAYLGLAELLNAKGRHPEARDAAKMSAAIFDVCHATQMTGRATELVERIGKD